jgi:hypothetical protein
MLAIHSVAHKSTLADQGELSQTILFVPNFGMVDDPLETRKRYAAKTG